MTDEKVLLIEKESSRTPTFGPDLRRKEYDIDVVHTGTAALKYVRSHKPVTIILNAPSLGSSGIRICNQIRESTDIPLIHILDQPGSDGSKAIIDCGCDISLSLPFTARKLINRIRRVWPVDHEDTLRVGDISYTYKTHTVRVKGREARLTPKAAHLLEVLLKHPRQTLDRAFLMQKVWDTKYTGDTRTLDVHIRWVRQAIEPDPASPTLLRTVRKVGYRLEPEVPRRDSKRKTP